MLHFETYYGSKTLMQYSDIILLEIPNVPDISHSVPCRQLLSNMAQL